MKLGVDLLVTFLLAAYCKADRCDNWDWAKNIKPVLFNRSLSTCGGMETNAHFPDAARQQIVDLHNGVRAAAANGCAKTTNGTLPMSSNMRIMVSFDIDFSEMIACIGFRHITTVSKSQPRPGQILAPVAIQYLLVKIFFTSDPFKTAIESFNNNELPRIGDRMLNNTKFVGNIRDITHYTAMIWAKTSSVGCGLSVCYKNPTVKYARGYTVVCHYHPIGNVIGFYAYEKGEPCKTDSDCIDEGFDKCVTSLGMCGNGQPKIGATFG
uniref:SCP domain-containing protein n=1 Tax=Panagrellus redivivus TaxID=6233 RepID=A0A7E4ZZX6_PANRE